MMTAFALVVRAAQHNQNRKLGQRAKSRSCTHFSHNKDKHLLAKHAVITPDMLLSAVRILSNAQKRMIFEDYISVSASIVISANTYTEADGCVSLLYVPTPAWPTGPCNPVAWFSSSIITFVFLEEV